jgi:hypothetical protein
VSGAQKWNGAAETLKANPVTIRNMLITMSDRSGPVRAGTAAAISASLMEPARP